MLTVLSVFGHQKMKLKGEEIRNAKPQVRELHMGQAIMARFIPTTMKLLQCIYQLFLFRCKCGDRQSILSKAPFMFLLISFHRKQ